MRRARWGVPRSHRRNQAAKAAGFLVTSNTTIYKETDIEEIAELFAYLQTLGVDGHMLSPAYSYAAVQTKEIFMSREEIQHKFQRASELLGSYNIMTSPLYLEYLRGERELDCTAWGKPTYNTRGWKGPCYLMTDAHHPNFKEFLAKHGLEQVRPRQTIRAARIAWCTSGYEPSAVLGGNKKLGDTWRMLSWQLSGRMGGAKGAPKANGHGNGHSNGHSNGGSNGHTPVNNPTAQPAKEEVFRIL